MRTHYDNLQVKETASAEVIKGAYRFLSQKWHPDKNEDKEEAERVLKIINRAYAVLSDPAQRKAHDEWIRQQRQEAPEPPPQAPPPTSPPTPPGEHKALAAARGSPRKSDYWLMRVWTYIILPMVILMIVLPILMDERSLGTGLVGAFNWQQLAVIIVCAALIGGLHNRVWAAWCFNWLPLVAVGAFLVKAGMLGGALGGLWLWWNISIWLRLKPLFTGEVKEPLREVYKPLKNKMWSGGKAFLISGPVFSCALLVLGVDAVGAILFSLIAAAVIGLAFAVVSDLELSR